MKKKIKLLTLCGTGGVTSAVVRVKAEKILEEAGYEVVSSSAKVIEARSSYESFKPDIIIASTPASIEGINVINGMPFLTGVGTDKLKEEILAEISKIG
jgi:PTS system galactitol-specific IIB component